MIEKPRGKPTPEEIEAEGLTSLDIDHIFRAWVHWRSEVFDRLAKRKPK